MYCRCKWINTRDTHKFRNCDGINSNLNYNVGQSWGWSQTVEPELNHQQQTETRTQLVQSWTQPRPISNISPEYCYVCLKVFILCVYLKSGLWIFYGNNETYILLYFREKKFVALKVVKSAAHYTETALDEIKLLKCVSWNISIMLKYPRTQIFSVKSNIWGPLSGRSYLIKL